MGKRLLTESYEADSCPERSLKWIKLEKLETQVRSQCAG